jgi:MSHA biogenesis protein MshE
LFKEHCLKLVDQREQAAILQATDATVAGGRPRLRLGELLVAQGVLTPQQLDIALSERKRSGRRLGRILVEDGIATEEAIARALAEQLHVPYVELSTKTVSPQICRLLTEAQVRRFRAIPIDEAGVAIRVGMADPLDYQSYDEIQRLLGRDLDLVVITESRLEDTLDRLHSRSDQISGLAKELEQELKVETVEVETFAQNVPAEEAPVAKLLQSLFEEAMRSRASDIHIEPQERKLQIRFRVDGALHLHTEAESRIAPAVVQRLKLTAGLDIAERRLPQDGRFVARARNNVLDMRISTMPTQYGESVVLRLLPHKGGLLDLDRLGMPAPVLANVGQGARFHHAGARHAAGDRTHRLGQDDHAVRGAGADELAGIQDHHGRGPGRIPSARHHPGPGQRKDRTGIFHGAALHPATGSRHRPGGRDAR